MTPDVQLKNRSHWWTLPTGGNGDKEEVYAEYVTAWRGAPAWVQIRASRYDYSRAHSGEPARWSDWNVYAVEAREWNPETNERKYGSLTETARRRLGEQLVPLVHEWLASDEYRESRRAAIVYAIKREFPGHGSERSVTWAQRAMERMWDAGEITLGQVETINAALVAWERYEQAVEVIA